MDKPRVAMWHRQKTAIGYYRTVVPARWLQRQGYEVDFREKGTLSSEWGSTEEALEKWAKEHHGIYDLVWTDRCIEPMSLGIFSGIRHYTPGCRLVVDFDDDFLSIPSWNQSQKSYHRSQQATEVSMAHLRMAEMATVSTEVLAREYDDKVHRVVVAKNAIDPVDWVGLAVDPDRAQDPNLRMLYGGAGGHYGDMDVARGALEKLIREPPVPWRLIVFGALPSWLHVLKRDYPGRVVGLPWIDFEDYPQVIAWGGFDLALAPLQKHPFNDAKSNIKWQEAAVQRIPLVCSDTGPYDWDIPPAAALKAKQSPESWEETLRAALTDPTLREKTAEVAWQAVNDEWVIDRRGRFWEDAIDEALACPRIESVEDARLKAPAGEVAPSSVA